jgi:hypothetical protein
MQFLCKISICCRLVSDVKHVVQVSLDEVLATAHVTYRFYTTKLLVADYRTDAFGR